MLQEEEDEAAGEGEEGVGGCKVKNKKKIPLSARISR